MQEPHEVLVQNHFQDQRITLSNNSFLADVNSEKRTHFEIFKGPTTQNFRQKN